jgi:16S rRNA processing protein RimM
MTDFPERFSPGRSVWIKTKGGDRYPREIEASRLFPPFAYVSFKGVATLNEADGLRGSVIEIPEEDRAPLPPGHYYRYELVGMGVVLEDGTRLGEITSVMETGGNDVYVVAHGPRDLLIPGIKSVVKKIDLVKREMLIRPMEGLLDL